MLAVDLVHHVHLKTMVTHFSDYALEYIKKLSKPRTLTQYNAD